jgi:carbamoyl-phosphate synthase large subunit
VGPRLDGYEIRTAAVLKGVPCITTIQGLAATVLGIESLLSGMPGASTDGGIGVRSLQEYAEDLSRLRATGGA